MDLTVQLESGVVIHKPLPPLPVDPPRVCFLVLKSVNNPVCSMNQAFAACGRTPRDKVDTLATDRNDVTCEDCRKVMDETPEGQEIQVRQPDATPTPRSVPLGESTSSPGGDLGGVLARLDVGELEARLKELEGEKAALKVLLKAARARVKARQEPVEDE